MIPTISIEQAQQLTPPQLQQLSAMQMMWDKCLICGCGRREANCGCPNPIQFHQALSIDETMAAREAEEDIKELLATTEGVKGPRSGRNLFTAEGIKICQHCDYDIEIDTWGDYCPSCGSDTPFNARRNPDESFRELERIYQADPTSENRDRLNAVRRRMGLLPIPNVHQHTEGWRAQSRFVDGTYVSSAAIIHDGWWGINHAFLDESGRYQRDLGDHLVNSGWETGTPTRDLPKPTRKEVETAHRQVVEAYLSGEEISEFRRWVWEGPITVPATCYNCGSRESYTPSYCNFSHCAYCFDPMNREHEECGWEGDEHPSYGSTEELPGNVWSRDVSDYRRNPGHLKVLGFTCRRCGFATDIQWRATEKELRDQGYKIAFREKSGVMITGSCPQCSSL
jgi:hypothetical protein